MNREQRFAPALFVLIGGFVIWAVHFMIIYGYAGLLCARPEWARLQVMNFGVVPFGVALATVAALIALAVLAAVSLQSGERMAGAKPELHFIPALGAGGAMLAAIAIVWEGIFSLLVVPACV